MIMSNQPLRFSGHDSFQCRYYWLKKGYDFIRNDGDFNSDDAPVQLGVGKNMVTAIRYWMISFGIYDIETKKLSQLAELLFDDNGWDPYLEDQGTLWLLHYHLVRNGYATSYSMIFNELRKRRPEFNQHHFLTWVEQSGGSSIAVNSLKTDLQIFSRTYIPRDDSKDLDENYSGLLTELNLVTKSKRETEHNGKTVKIDWFTIEPKRRPEIPTSILLYCILEKGNHNDSISFDTLYNDGVGSIFSLNREGLVEKLVELDEKFDEIIFSNQAGVKELQITKDLIALDVLRDYYAN